MICPHFVDTPSYHASSKEMIYMLVTENKVTLKRSSLCYSFPFHDVYLSSRNYIYDDGLREIVVA